MPKKESFSKENIINAAFTLIRKKGVKSLSARNIAKVLNSSTMPIYKQFNSIDELDYELAKLSADLMNSYQTDTYTGNTLVDIAFGYIQFAIKEKELFKQMFLNEKADKKLSHKLGMNAYNIIKTHLFKTSQVKNLTENEFNNFFNRLRIFIHGTACLLIYDPNFTMDEQVIIDLIDETITMLLR